MAHSFVLTLTAEQNRELMQAQDHATQPYVREHTACSLKVAADQSIRAVAHSGDLRPRRPKTVKAWLST